MGCGDELFEWFEANKITWVTILASIAALQVMCIGIAIYILSRIKRLKKLRYEKKKYSLEPTKIFTFRSKILKKNVQNRKIMKKKNHKIQYIYWVLALLIFNQVRNSYFFCFLQEFANSFQKTIIRLFFRLQRSS